MPWFLAAHLFSWYLGTCLHGQNEVTIYPQRTLLSQWLVWIYPQRAHWASLTSKGWLSSTSEVVPLAATLCSCAVSPNRQWKKNKTLSCHWGQTVYYLFEISSVTKQWTLERVWRKRSPLALRWNVNWGSYCGEEYGGAFNSTRNKTTTWPSNATTGHIPWENHNSKRHTYPNVHCSTIYNSQDVEAT